MIIKTTKEDVLIDAADYDLLKDYNWHINKRGHNLYVQTSIWDVRDKKTKHIKMHRLIMNAPEGTFVDHINRDGLDNRRCNLRLCTKAQNQWNRAKQANNTTGFKGVYTNRASYKKRFRAEIWKDRKSVYLGSFETAEEAAIAYNKAAVRLFGEFACLNDITV